MRYDGSSRFVRVDLEPVAINSQASYLDNFCFTARRINEINLQEKRPLFFFLNYSMKLFSNSTTYSLFERLLV